MDPGKKSTSDTGEKSESMSEIDKKLEKIKSKFYDDYNNWVEKKKESSSQHGNKGRSKANCVETEPWVPGKKKESSSQHGNKGRSKANCVETEPELPDHDIHDSRGPQKFEDRSYKHGNRSTDGDSSTPRNSSSKKGRSKVNCVETEPELPDHDIHGFVNESLFLKSYLLKQKESKEFKTLAIVGKYGVGKTTLCQSVFNDKEVKKAYLPRIWVSMYSKEKKENEDPKIDVVKRILGSLGVEDEMLGHIKTDAEEEKRIKDEAGEREEETVKEKELSRLLNALHLNLIGKKYLIVLDDVWEDKEWEDQQGKTNLSCGFPKGFGGRVIVTTRDKCLAKKIVGEEENLQRLFPRSDEESIWNIYQDAVPLEYGDAVAVDAGNAKALKLQDALLPMTDVQGMHVKIRSHAHVLLSANQFMDRAVDAGNPKVNPKYPGRFKKELMDKSCGVPLAARMLAKIKPVEMEDIIKEANMDRKKSF